jgi:hypothetical protein
MKRISIFIFISISLLSCSGGKYDVSKYYDRDEQDSVLTSIVNYIFDAPPYTSIKDRFKSEHRKYYASLTSKFSIDQYFIDQQGKNYFLVLRPAPRVGEVRAVGGYFTMHDNYQLAGFREIFVTPELPTTDAKTKGEFLFDKLVRGEVDEYLKMKSFAQWPNEASVYDTVIYEWKLISQQ